MFRIHKYGIKWLGADVCQITLQNAQFNKEQS